MSPCFRFRLNGCRYTVNPEHLSIVQESNPPRRFQLPQRQPQELPLNYPESGNFFRQSAKKPLVTTPAALEMYGQVLILACLGQLVQLAEEYYGLDYLQVFTSKDHAQSLWFIEDGEGGAITALLPDEY